MEYDFQSMPCLTSAVINYNAVSFLMSNHMPLVLHAITYPCPIPDTG